MEENNRYIPGETLGQAIESFRGAIHANPIPNVVGRLSEIEDDYRLLQHYMQQGYKDEKREQLYQTLRRKLDQLMGDYRLAVGNPVAASQSQQEDQAEIIHTLQAFAADIALAGQGYNADRLQEKYQAHTQYTEKLFLQLCRAPQWNEPTAQFYQELILSPTIHTNDAQLIVSALTLALINIFDVRKFILLTNVYTLSVDEQVRQKALVGWALSIHNKLHIYPEIEQTLRQLLSEQKVREEVLQLQMQIYLCMNAEKDQQHIQQDIMPNIINNSNLNITPFGVTEKEDDQLQDILNPDAADKAIEDVERSMQKMMDMQRAGTDIYFGGFMHMKNFPFFYQIANWFRPFDINHPALSKAREALGANSPLAILGAQTSLCDSDKYSFTLAFANMIDKIPKNILEALNSSDAFPAPFAENGEGESLPASSTLIRRLYLQTLYRFFHLYRDKKQFFNPFQPLNKQHTLYRYPQLAVLCRDTMTQLARFLYKQKQYQDLQLLLQNYPDSDNQEMQNIRAYLHIRNRQYKDAIVLWEGATQPSAMQLLAKAYYLNEEYAKAEEIYRQLTEKQESQLSHQLNYARCLIKQKKNKEALHVLFKCHYNTPDNVAVMQLLAWAQLCEKKTGEALELYGKILQQQPDTPENQLNAAYAYWVTHQVKEAQALFRKYIEGANPSDSYQLLQQAFASDGELLDSYRISPVERQIMADIVCGKA